MKAMRRGPIGIQFILKQQLKYYQSLGEIAATQENQGLLNKIKSKIKTIEDQIEKVKEEVVDNKAAAKAKGKK